MATYEQKAIISGAISLLVTGGMLLWHPFTPDSCPPMQDKAVICVLDENGAVKDPMTAKTGDTALIVSPDGTRQEVTMSNVTATKDH